MSKAIAVTGLLTTSAALGDLEKILAYPAWNAVLELIDRLRLYHEGLELSTRLETALFLHHGEMPERNWVLKYQLVKNLHLRMLDKLDMWEKYVDEWDRLRNNADLSVSFRNSLSRVSENGLPSDFESSRQDESKDPKQDFILSEDGERQLVHFLFSLRHRKEVIDRKLARHHAGKLRKTDYHHSRDQLTP